MYAHCHYSGLLFDICCIELRVEQGKRSRLSIFAGNVNIDLPFSCILRFKIQKCLFCIEILKATKTRSQHVHFVNLSYTLYRTVLKFLGKVIQETNPQHTFFVNIFSMFVLYIFAVPVFSLIMDFFLL